VRRLKNENAKLNLLTAEMCRDEVILQDGPDRLLARGQRRGLDACTRHGDVRHTACCARPGNLLISSRGIQIVEDGRVSQLEWNWMFKNARTD